MLNGDHPDHYIARAVDNMRRERALGARASAALTFFLWWAVDLGTPAVAPLRRPA